MYSPSRHQHQLGKGDTKTASDEPQATGEVCGGAAVCWPQAGVHIFEPSLSYLEAPGAKLGGCGGPYNQARWPDHPASVWHCQCLLNVFCPRSAFLQDLIFKTRIQLRAVRKVIKIKGHLITISETVADFFFFFWQGTGFRPVISSSKYCGVKYLLTHLFVSHLITVSWGS